MYGTIISAWKIDNGVFRLKVTIPPNTTALVHLPADDTGKVRENKQLVEKARGVKLLKSKAGSVVLEIGSGTYEFETPYQKAVIADVAAEKNDDEANE